MTRARFFYFFDEAEEHHRLWFPDWGIPQPRMKHPLALAAGAQSAETNEDLAQSEGRQSGPKGNAQKDKP